MLTTRKHSTVDSTANQALGSDPELTLVESETSNPAHPGITGGGGEDNNPFLCDGGARIENSEVYQSYLLIQSVLYHSFMEIKRKSSQAAEVEFWRSRRADFFVYLMNLHRDLMGLEPIHADAYRRGIAAKLKQDHDWLMPEDGLDDEEVEAFCENYMDRWRELSQAYPDGVDDPTEERMFKPNPPKADADKPVRDPREPTPISEYREQRQQAEVKKTTASASKASSQKGREIREEQLEFPLEAASDTAQASVPAMGGSLAGNANSAGNAAQVIIASEGMSQAHTPHPAMASQVVMRQSLSRAEPSQGIISLGDISTEGVAGRPAAHQASLQVSAPADKRRSLPSAVSRSSSRDHPLRRVSPHAEGSPSTGVSPRDVFGPAMEKAIRASATEDPPPSVDGLASDHPALLLGTHPLYRDRGKEDARNGQPRLRFKTQWVSTT